MTLEEKASLCSGLNLWQTKPIERLGIPSDHAHGWPARIAQTGGCGHISGFNTSVPATCFPTASALAATWNRDLVHRSAQLWVRNAGRRSVCDPWAGANIKRSPLCGRNFEYFSEDPFLSGEMAKSYIQGVQSQGWDLAEALCGQ
jgi:beta-glucosidase